MSANAKGVNTVICTIKIADVGKYTIVQKIQTVI